MFACISAALLTSGGGMLFPLRPSRGSGVFLAGAGGVCGGFFEPFRIRGFKITVSHRSSEASLGSGLGGVWNANEPTLAASRGATATIMAKDLCQMKQGDLPNSASSRFSWQGPTPVKFALRFSSLFCIMYLLLLLLIAEVCLNSVVCEPILSTRSSAARHFR